MKKLIFIRIQSIFLIILLPVLCLGQRDQCRRVAGGRCGAISELRLDADHAGGHHQPGGQRFHRERSHRRPRFAASFGLGEQSDLIGDG